MTDDALTTEPVAEYDHIMIVREPRTGEPDRYHVEDPLERLKSCKSKAKTELYADVYTVVSGFREDRRAGCPASYRCGPRGRAHDVPDSPADHVPRMIARFYDADEAVKRRYVNAVQDRTTAARSGTDADPKTTNDYPVLPPDPDAVESDQDDDDD